MGTFKYTLLLITVLCISCIFGEKVKIIIPEEYEGDILIFFDCPDGQSKRYDGEWRVLEIPSSGILHTKFHYDMQNMLIGTKLYYFRTKDGKYLPIHDGIMDGERKNGPRVISAGVVGLSNNRLGYFITVRKTDRPINLIEYDEYLQYDCL